jgi:hypothetical protein
MFVKETVMLVRSLVIAATLTMAAAAVAEPPKPQTPPANPPATRPAQVVLASADTLSAPAPDAAQPSQAPVKRRTARVTSCRCGDPQQSEQ